MKKIRKILTYIEWLIIYCLMALGIRVVLMFLQSGGNNIEVSLTNVGNSLYFAGFIWIVHLFRGEIPWRPNKDLNFEKKKQ
jgi:hypothetical protein